LNISVHRADEYYIHPFETGEQLQLDGEKKVGRNMITGKLIRFFCKISWGKVKKFPLKKS
jgi:hypothetical protein